MGSVGYVYVHTRQSELEHGRKRVQQRLVMVNEQDLWRWNVEVSVKHARPGDEPTGERNRVYRKDKTICESL